VVVHEDFKRGYELLDLPDCIGEFVIRDTVRLAPFANFVILFEMDAVATGLALLCHFPPRWS